MAEMQTWLVAGPLFDIWTDAEEKVAAVHLPHFLCLGGEETDISLMKIAHFVEARLTLEKPARVTRFHAVLEKPKFSLLGVLIKPLYDKFFSVHAVVILYQILKNITTLNLYLVPNDSSLIQAIQDAEEKFHSVLVRKPPQTIMPLHYGSRYTVSSSVDLKIIPKELHFTYKNPRHQQSYVQFSIRSTEIVDISLKNKEDLCSVWDTSLEPGASCWMVDFYG
ncbi:caspase recruitment domain-containing protein 8-like [Heteronotia binoei]|uniref:caspase recruitment domain-containing protein 8-like n=1 Tax=Heteronotia binoei TaxID=13085 RepID=UPI00292F4A12|nr:caspase recruitment domain-containing protein 8-like [Heteronotia binoei]